MSCMRHILLVLQVLPLLVLVFGVAEARRKGGSGTLDITSLTAGAEVQVDGKVVGTLPLKGVRLPEGKHTLKITLKGYTEYLDVFTIQRNQTTALDIDLLPYAGVLRITSNVRGARVFIDNKFEGLAPIEREILIGKRSVRVRKAGYYDYIGEVSAIAGKTFDVHVRLKAMPVGSTPYRPTPPPPPKWYEKWYVWVGGAAGVAAVTAAIVVPVVLMNQDPFGDACRSADHCYQQ